jgi:transposase
VEQQDMTVTGAAKVLGVNRKTATVWLRRYRTKRGKERFRQERRGRRQGDRHRLTAAQERAVQKLICGRVPTEAGLSSYALWTRDAVAALIAERYGINLAVRTIEGAKFVRF